MLWIFSQGKPMRSSTPGPKFSTSTSQVLISAVRTSLPFGFLVSSVIDRGVDQGGLAGIHRRVDGALQFVRRGGVDADAAKGLHHLVVARALDEDGGGGIGVD